MNIQLRGNEFIVQKESEANLNFWKNIDNWEPFSFDIIDKYLTTSGTFIDCGSWNGVLSMHASTIAEKVYAFEPDVNAFAKLDYHVQVNDITLFGRIWNTDGFSLGLA
jgi:hypothetical protein